MEWITVTRRKKPRRSKPIQDISLVLPDSCHNDIELPAWEPPDRELSRDKHTNHMIRKAANKLVNYRCSCCSGPPGNPNKPSLGRSCGYPRAYRRRDITVENKQICRNNEVDLLI